MRERYQRGPPMSEPDEPDEPDGAPGGVERGTASTPDGRPRRGGSPSASSELNARPMPSRYGIDADHPEHGPGEVEAVLVASALALGVWWQPEVRWILGLGTSLALLTAVITRWRCPYRLLAAVVCLLAVGSFRGGQAWEELTPDRLGPWEGWTTVVRDPEPSYGAWRVVLQVEGERFEVREYGRAAGLRVSRWQVGERVLASGTLRSLDTDRLRWLASQHIVGRFDIEWVSDGGAAVALHRFTNKVRDAVTRASTHIDAPHDALYLGLVVGDDRNQPDDMIERFRASGLSHLTAVSGQNVAFVLAAAGPMLRLLSAWTRWGVTCALILWFVTFTRFEPSILRAGVMAGLTATAFVLGRPQHPARIVALSVIGLVLLDPLLVWSIGFWLSVGATLGVTTVGPWLARRLHRWGPLALPVGITLGAQLGVAAPALLVFHRLPLVSLPANVLAVPVAGAVMLYGLPAGLVAANVPWIAGVVMAPVDVGVRWVDTVAVVASALEPPGLWAALGWVVVTSAVVAALWRNRDAPPGSRTGTMKNR